MKEQQHFPFKLYNMLEYADISEHGATVSWVKGGHAFAIHNKEAFLEHLVPKFFNQTKFRSFTRQLNLWGFTRLSKEGPNREGGSWKHELFVRGRADKLASIQRKECKRGKPKADGRLREESKLHQSWTAAFDEAGSMPPAAFTRNGLPTSNSFVKSNPDAFVQPLVPNKKFLSRTQECTTPFLPSKSSFRAAGELESIDEVSTVFQERDHFVSNETTIKPNETMVMLPPYYAQHQTEWSCQAPPSKLVDLTTSLDDFNDNERNMSPLTLPTSCEDTEACAAPHKDSHSLSACRSNEDDFLFALSGIIDSDESSRDDDLSSILSLDEASDYLAFDSLLRA